MTPAMEREKIIKNTLTSIEQTRGQLFYILDYLGVVRATALDDRKAVDVLDLTTTTLDAAYKELLHMQELLMWQDVQLSQRDITEYAAQVRKIRCGKLFQDFLGLVEA